MQKRILIVSQEVTPYIPDGKLAQSVLDSAKIIKKNKNTEVGLNVGHGYRVLERLRKGREFTISCTSAWVE